jgi:CRP/FNR family transcriptional activator FtrB
MTEPVPQPLTEADVGRVRGVGLFAPLSPEALAGLLDQARVVTVPPLARLLEPDQPAGHLLVVIDGMVGMLAAVSAQETCLVELVGPGQVFGEAGLFDRGRSIMAARAITECRLVLIPAAAMLGCLDAQPAFRRQMLAFLSRRLRGLVRQIVQLKLMTVSQRLGSFLLGMIGRRSGPQTLRLACERRLIAGMLGMTPESLSRALHHLREVGVSSPGPREILIGSPERLRGFVAGHGAGSGE